MMYEMIHVMHSNDPYSDADAIPDVGAYRVENTYQTVFPDITYICDGQWHRNSGPAYIDIEEQQIFFCINGRIFSNTQVFCNSAGMSGEETLMWVLQFGDKLPTTIKGFYGENWKDMTLDQF